MGGGWVAETVFLGRPAQELGSFSKFTEAVTF